MWLIPARGRQDITTSRHDWYTRVWLGGSRSNWYPKWRFWNVWLHFRSWNPVIYHVYSTIAYSTKLLLERLFLLDVGPSMRITPAQYCPFVKHLEFCSHLLENYMLLIWSHSPPARQTSIFIWQGLVQQTFWIYHLGIRRTHPDATWLTRILRQPGFAISFCLVSSQSADNCVDEAYQSNPNRLKTRAPKSAHSWVSVVDGGPTWGR